MSSTLQMDPTLACDIADANAAFKRIMKAWKPQLKAAGQRWLCDLEVMAAVQEQADVYSLLILDFEMESAHHFQRIEELVRKVVNTYPHCILQTEEFMKAFAMLVHKATLPMFQDEVRESLAFLEASVHPSAMQIVHWTIMMARNDRCRAIPAYAQTATNEEVEAWIESMPSPPPRIECGCPA